MWPEIQSLAAVFVLEKRYLARRNASYVARLVAGPRIIHYANQCALQKNKHVKAFFANFETQSDGNSELDDQDALDDLVALILKISHINKENNNHGIDQEENEDHEVLNVFFNNLSNCAVAHTFTHDYPPPFSQRSTQHAEVFRGIFIGTSAG